MNSNTIYKAAAYVRSSKDDNTSDTIENQIALIRSYVKSIPDIEIISVREDSGFSGVSLVRPDFIEMMKDIESKKINCVIVKDLSRLGRNFIEVGELLDVLFPQHDIRVIAITDNYDSLNPRTDADYILLPFKNIINEQYLRDFSINIRRVLDNKRKSGQFVASFAPYGYKRDPNDKHKLIIDEHAAQVVRQIFKLKIEGNSAYWIANWLNEIGEPSPAEHKRKETNYANPFQKHDKSKWDSKFIGQVLGNPIYIGILIQGKETTPSYKIKKRITKPENEWHIIPDNHESIISKRDFETAAILLRQDTRVSSKTDKLYPLSGYAYCGDCGNSMKRSGTGKYVYYVCASSMKKGVCSAHGIREKDFENVVRDAISKQAALIVDITEAFELARKNFHLLKNNMNLNEKINDRENEITFCKNNKVSLYDDYKKGLISSEDLVKFAKQYESRITAAKQAKRKIQVEMELLLKNKPYEDHPWIEHIKKHKNLSELNRQAVVSVIERIVVYTGKRIQIYFRYQDELEAKVNILKDLHSDMRGDDDGADE